ncbi:MAG: Rieske 2Fe-2S domain-containing protein, partial [Acidobacteriota bacterium]
MTSVSELRQFVDWEHGLISPAVLFDEDVYRQEQERVFGHSWLVVGHEDMVRKPGDYITNYMGETPVILVRDMKGEIHVNVNKCVHRGNQVCLYDRGNARGFTCSYHGWTYDLTGDLIGVPMEKELYRGELAKDEWGLVKVPKVTNFHGMIFANFDPEAP